MRSQIYLIAFVLLLAGCASTAVIKPQYPAAPAQLGAVYHRIEKGETLWAVSKKYSVDMDDLAKVNNILDTTRVEVGQLIIIPENKRVAPVNLPGNVYSKDDFIWPLEGKVVSSFGQSFNSMVNKGLNIQVSGSNTVLASRGGRIVFYSDNFLSFGKTIIIDHLDGFLTVYSGINEIMVKPGDNVLGGVSIARIYAANNPKGDRPYLHFEIRKGYLAQNPYFYLP
jgi:murein DD-endopeptidase MepM/ murein hydrolase activator NlpD